MHKQNMSILLSSEEILAALEEIGRLEQDSAVKEAAFMKQQAEIDRLHVREQRIHTELVYVRRENVELRREIAGTHAYNELLKRETAYYKKQMERWR